MSKPKIVYISKNMNAYQGAMYQKNVMDELARQADVFFYGPGFPQYNISDDIQDVIKKSNMKPDYIFLGHAWLSDKDGEKVDSHENLALHRTTLLKIAILNKEYINLDQKLEYLKNNKFNLVFTHHHEVEMYERRTGIKFVFWPFAFDHRVFTSANKQEKQYDLAFSGILQNQTRNAHQTDIRVRIQKKIFICFRDVPLFKRRGFRNYNIFWNIIPRRKIERYIAILLKRYHYLPLREYSELQQKARIYLNTLSPMGLVSPRFFENMASGVLVLCEKSDNYKNIFQDDCYVCFQQDLQDFEEKLKYYLSNEAERKKIVDKAYKAVMANHTWEKRITSMINTIGRCL